MKINILRGQNQIGGSIIELSTENTRIVLDAGSNLGEAKATLTFPLPQVCSMSVVHMMGFSYPIITPTTRGCSAS